MTTCKHGHLQTDAEASKTSFKSTACCERNLHQNTPPPKKKKKNQGEAQFEKTAFCFAFTPASNES